MISGRSRKSGFAGFLHDSGTFGFADCLNTLDGALRQEDTAES